MAALSAMKMKMLSRSTPSLSRSLFPLMHRSYASKLKSKSEYAESLSNIDNNVVPTSGIRRPLSEVLEQLNKNVRLTKEEKSLLKGGLEDGCSFEYIPRHIAIRIMNLRAPGWSGEVRSITYSADGNSVSVAYRVTIAGTDAEIYRESTGTASVNDSSHGNPVQRAEAIAFRGACACFGLGIHIYHDPLSKVQGCHGQTRVT